MNDNERVQQAALEAVDALMNLVRAEGTEPTIVLESAKAVLELYRWTDSKEMQEKMMRMQSDRSGLFG